MILCLEHFMVKYRRVRKVDAGAKTNPPRVNLLNLIIEGVLPMHRLGMDE